MRCDVLLPFIIKNHYQMNQANDRIKKPENPASAGKNQVNRLLYETDYVNNIKATT